MNGNPEAQMAVLCVAAVILLLMLGLSIAADKRFRDERTLPIQWSLSGTVNWSARRRIALGLLPAMAAAFLAVYFALTIYVPVKAGQESMILPVLILIGAIFIATQILYLRLVNRILSRQKP